MEKKVIKKEKKELVIKKKFKPALVAHAFTPSTQEAEVGGFLCSRSGWFKHWVPGQDSQNTTESIIYFKRKQKDVELNYCSNFFMGSIQFNLWDRGTEWESLETSVSYDLG